MKRRSYKIIYNKLQEQVYRPPNWKTRGRNGVHGYLFKNIKSTSPVIVTMLNETVESGSIPDLLTELTITLIAQDPAKGNEVSNFRPVTCLPIMWKVFTRTSAIRGVAQPC